MPLSEQLQQIKSKCELRYASFCQLLQDDGWFDPKHKELCDFIQGEIEKPGDVNLLVVMARGTLKSTIVTKYLPIWLTLKDRDMRSLIAINTHPNARKRLADIRGIFDDNETFRAIWPDMLPNKLCRWTDEAAEIPRTKAFPEATFEACGLKTKKTSTHYNLIIEDDTLAPDDSSMGIDITMPTIAQTEQAIGWHKTSTALLPPKGKRIRVVVSTRWSDYDLVQYIYDKEHYATFNLPAMDEQGNPNFSIFYSKEQLADIQAGMGLYMFSCLYLNKPLDPSLRKFQREWLKEIYLDEVPTEFPGDYTVAIDPAISEKDTACETSITRVKHVMQQGQFAHQYWTDSISGHLNPYETVQRALDFAELAQFETRAIIVEANAYQAALKYILQDEMVRRKVHYNIVLIHSRTQKNIRIEAMIPYFETHRIHFLHRLPPAVENQLLQYPHGRLMDIIDCFAMHMEFGKRDKKQVTIVTKPRVDPNSIEAVLESIKNRRGATSYQAPLASYNMSTGLGIDADIRAGGLR